MTMWKTIAAVAVPYALLVTDTVTAQQWQVFNMDNTGLPSNTVTDMVQDAQGIIWVATDWGLCRFNGQDWTVIQQAPGGLPDNMIRCLALDADDRLWVGTTLAGIAILEGTEWTYLNMANAPLATDEIAGITHDHRGWAWISTELGLHCWTGSEWYLYNDGPDSHDGYQFFGPNVRGVAVREDGLVSIATRNAGLTYIAEDGFVFYTAANSGFPDNSANGIALDANGDRWLATPSSGLIHHAGPYQGGPWFTYSAFTMGFPNSTMNCVTVDATDRKVVGTETWGVLLFRNAGDWTALNQQNSGLPDNDVRSVLVDAEGMLWAGTGTGGVARYDLFAGLSGAARTGSGLHAWPSPTTGELNVDLSTWTEPARWRLYGSAGRLCAEGSVEGGGMWRVSLDEQAPGVYVLQLASQGSAAHVCIVRQ